MPSLLIGLINAPEIVSQYNLSSMKKVLVGAAPLSQEVLVQLEPILPNAKFLQVYGMTEAVTMITATSPDDIMLGSCGYLLPGYEARILDEDGLEILELEHRGELVLRGPTVTPGYLKNEAALKGMLTEDGWLRTGDLVILRRGPKGHNHIFVVDRIKELMKVHVSLSSNIPTIHLLKHTRRGVGNASGPCRTRGVSSARLTSGGSSYYWSSR